MGKHMADIPPKILTKQMKVSTHIHLLAVQPLTLYI